MTAGKREAIMWALIVGCYGIDIANGDLVGTVRAIVP